MSGAAVARQADVAAAGAPPPDVASVTLTVANMTCGSCVRSIEDTLMSAPGVAAARVNLGARRVNVQYDPQRSDIIALAAALKNAGFDAAPLDEMAVRAGSWSRDQDLLPRVGVAGFAAANIMLMSVSVWSGHSTDMDASVQTLFHWISALIALPAIAYAGQPFFRSARTALAARRLNMDVPISLGITLATAMSLFQTMRGTEQVYFDAAVTLVFFLLIGRLLDERMRLRARGAAENLMGLNAITATVIEADGAARLVSARVLQPGMRILVAAGERIAADGIIREGVSDIDESLITGETVPRAVKPGECVHAGAVNGGGILKIETTASADNSLLAEIARMMQAAEQGRATFVRLADRAARLYAPAVHVLGASTFIGWMLAGAGWEPALTAAIAVLIITCPCALALAVPAVQVAAMSRLFAGGVIVKSGDGLERLSEVDTIVFDKTGTLTVGNLELAGSADIDATVLSRAASLAISSRHPYALALVRAGEVRGLRISPVEGVREVPGCGLAADTPQGEERLGSADWVGIEAWRSDVASLWLSRPGDQPIGFRFEDRLRDDAVETVASLRDAGYAIELMSGDRQAAVERAARALGLDRWRGACRPEGKLSRLSELAAQGRRTLMVGDGLNDAPALAAGHASLSPASAADIAQTAADVVFQGDNLAPVAEALRVARAAHRMSLQNFAIAILYNVAFVPLAALGYVTPLIAALAMSTSSIVVTANAVRLRSTKLYLAAPRAAHGA